MRVKRLMRSKRVMRIKYGFARKATYALEAAYAYKVRLLRVSDLCLRAFLLLFDVAMAVLRIPMLLHVVMT